MHSWLLPHGMLRLMLTGVEGFPRSILHRPFIGLLKGRLVISCRDLKAENVLQHSDGSWVLCDFGSTTSWSGHYEGTNEIMVAEEEVRKYTTPAYRPPEVGTRITCALSLSKQVYWQSQGHSI